MGLDSARILQGVGAAAFVPASLSLLTATFAEGEERNCTIGVYGAMAALGFVVGMVGGGVITEFLGWRWVFFVNAPVAVGAFLATAASIPECREEAAPRTLDVSGVVTATLGLASLIYAVSKIPDGGWTSPATLGVGASGVLLLALFVLAERRCRWYPGGRSEIAPWRVPTRGSSSCPWSACLGSTCSRSTCRTRSDARRFRPGCSSSS